MSDEDWDDDGIGDAGVHESRRSPDDLDYDERPRQQKKGMGTGLKVVIALLVGSGVMCIICCGVGVYMTMNAVQFSQEPADAVATAKEIVEIDIPEDQFPPMGMMKIDFAVFKMKMAMYGDQNGQGNFLVLAEASVANASDDQMIGEMRKSMRQQQMGKELRVVSSEEREIEINGEMVTFVFAEAVNDQTDEKHREITGTFTGKNGAAMIMIQVSEEDYDEAAILQMLSSIHQ